MALTAQIEWLTSTIDEAIGAIPAAQAPDPGPGSDPGGGGGAHRGEHADKADQSFRAPTGVAQRGPLI